MLFIGLEEVLGIGGVKEQGDLLLFSVDVDDRMAACVEGEVMLSLLGQTAHAAVDDAPGAVAVQHALEDVDVLACKGLLAVLQEELAPGHARRLFKVVVLGDEPTAEMEGADKAKGTLPCSPASDEDDGGTGVEDALIFRGRAARHGDHLDSGAGCDGDGGRVSRLRCAVVQPGTTNPPSRDLILVVDPFPALEGEEVAVLAVLVVAQRRYQGSRRVG